MGNTLEFPQELYQIIGSELPYSTKIVLRVVSKFFNESINNMQNPIEFQHMISYPSNHHLLQKYYDYVNISMYIHHPSTKMHTNADCVEHRYTMVLYDAIKSGNEQLAIWASKNITDLDSKWNENVPFMAVYSGKFETLKWVNKLFKYDGYGNYRTCYTLVALKCAIVECNIVIL